MGETYAEFHVDEQAMYEMVLEVFYRKARCACGFPRVRHAFLRIGTGRSFFQPILFTV